ncbi:hypothetical protein Tco_0764575 [Tanacetum coccineum]
MSSPSLPKAPLPPSTVGTNSPSNQFVQSSGIMMMGGNVLPFVYGASSLPPPPPSMPHGAMGRADPGYRRHGRRPRAAHKKGHQIFDVVN